MKPIIVLICIIDIDLILSNCFNHRSGYKQPVYINFIRDPFERIVSGFYYLKLSAIRAKRPLPEERFNMVNHYSCVFAKRNY